jgi:hypothetical protein
MHTSICCEDTTLKAQASFFINHLFFKCRDSIHKSKKKKKDSLSSSFLASLSLGPILSTTQKFQTIITFILFCVYSTLFLASRRINRNIYEAVLKLIVG